MSEQPGEGGAGWDDGEDGGASWDLPLPTAGDKTVVLNLNVINGSGALFTMIFSGASMAKIQTTLGQDGGPVAQRISCNEEYDDVLLTFAKEGRPKLHVRTNLSWSAGGEANVRVNEVSV